MHVDGLRESLLAEYAQVNENFRLLTDIRFKLLAFLPVATGAGLVVVKLEAARGDELSQIAALGFSLFGLAVTIGLATYNDRNDQLYDTLVGRAASIERQLGIPDGAFANRLRPWLMWRLGPISWEIDHRSGVGIIYAATAVLWSSGILVAGLLLAWPAGAPPGWAYGVAVGAAVALVTACRESIGMQRENRATKLRSAVRQAAQLARDHGFTAAAEDEDFLAACATVNGSRRQTEARAEFYSRTADSSNYITAGSSTASAQFVALITDMPPEWISDVLLERRGPPKPRQGWLRRLRRPSA